MLDLDHATFEKLVVDELDLLPDEMVKDIENVVFVTEDRPEDGSLSLFGLYQGVSITHRENYGYGELPDRIVIYREPMLHACHTLEELHNQVHITLVHEIGHYFGLDDEELQRLGWA